ncbi:hypothetical protein QJS04_geneDACA020885 [Acorus gramineus]|uniref:Sacsin/Nov domain-containing protein n=1 Tax=Acorus gramineus TaxID=55184 RepID=A0AAV9B2Y5_ACOGR|nr:hypothetical protein QJS04_geneDACA020885 [Acorus gramineus]
MTLLIFNNEKGFSPKNIESICGVGRSTKKGNRQRGYIGEKGIGFKSVFLITSQPHIFSNNYQIRFNEFPTPDCNLGYIVPEWVDNNPTLSDVQKIYGRSKPLPTTTIILPLKSDKVSAVKHQLSTVHPEVLLFLTKIKRLSVREDNEDPGLNTVNAISISRDCDYYMWKQKFPVRVDSEVERRREVEEWMVTGFPFIIQADFILASSRETILLDNKWNKGILSCVASAFVSAFDSLLKTSQATPDFSLPPIFKFLPVNSSAYPELDSVRMAIKEKVVSENFIPCESYTNQRIFCKPGEVGRLIPDLWDILADARKQGVGLEDLSSHGTYILSSAFDAPQYNDILEFLGVDYVDANWYAKCVTGSNLVMGVSEDLYVRVLYYFAENWGDYFHCTNDNKHLAIAFAYFMYHSLKKKCMSEGQVRELCRSMPLVDNYGGLGKNWSGVLVPAKGSKWIGLLGSNPWRRQGFIELSGDYSLAGKYAGLHTPEKSLLKFMQNHVGASDVPCISPPNAAFTTVASPLTRENALLLLKWISNLRNKGTRMPEKFLTCIRDGNWVKTSAGYKSPSDSFLSSSDWGCLLQMGSLLVDIPLIDLEFYGKCIEKYKEELKAMGVMFEFREACQFIGKHFMSLASSRDLTRSKVFSMLKFMRFLREKYLPTEDFVKSVMSGRWLKTVAGMSSPIGSILPDFEWTAASIISHLPFIDSEYYGDEILSYNTELQLLGVVVGFNRNYQLVMDNFEWPLYMASITVNCAFLILECIRHASLSDDLLCNIRRQKWVKTNHGLRSPSECFLFDSDWNCLMSVADDVPLIDVKFYESRIQSYKDELKKIGVVVRFEEASIAVSKRFKALALKNSLTKEQMKAFGVTVEFQMGPRFVITGLCVPTYSAGIAPDSVIALLKCIRNLKSGSVEVSFPKEFASHISKKWLKTVAGYRSPKECILFDSSWASHLERKDGPFIDEDFYGSDIKTYKAELVLLGVTTDVENGLPLLAGHLEYHSCCSVINRIYKYLKMFKWVPDNKTANWVWIPNGDDNGKWVNPVDCVLHDKDDLYSECLHVLDKIYENEMVNFFSMALGVRQSPSVADYIDLWKGWENSKTKLAHNECCAFWICIASNWSKKTEKLLFENIKKLPVISTASGGIALSDKDDVFIPDDMQLKDAFDKANFRSVFVWYPQPSLASVTRTKLYQIYASVGVRTISKSVKIERPFEMKGRGDARNVNKRYAMVRDGLFRIVLAFLSDISLELSMEKRHQTVKCIQKERIEFATYFSQVVSEGLMWDEPDRIGGLSELIKLGCLLKFEKDAVNFLLMTKNLHVLVEDEQFLISEVSSSV